MTVRRDDAVGERAKVHELANELFSLVETDQGHFFVSDGETFATTAQFFKRIRGRLMFGERACKKMRSFLRKYGELKP